MVQHSACLPSVTVLARHPPHFCREERKLQRLQKQLQRIDLLLIDEMGYVPFSKTAAELLFKIISRAYERHSVMLTTNLAFEQWTEIFGNRRPARPHHPSMLHHRG